MLICLYVYIFILYTLSFIFIWWPHILIIPWSLFQKCFRAQRLLGAQIAFRGSPSGEPLAVVSSHEEEWSVWQCLSTFSLAAFLFQALQVLTAPCLFNFCGCAFANRSVASTSVANMGCGGSAGSCEGDLPQSLPTTTESSNKTWIIKLSALA